MHILPMSSNTGINPIEHIAVTGVLARDCYVWLYGTTKNYSRWITKNLSMFEYGTDYMELNSSVVLKSPIDIASNNQSDLLISINMVKHLALLSNTDIALGYRDRLIKHELSLINENKTIKRYLGNLAHANEIEQKYISDLLEFHTLGVHIPFLMNDESNAIFIYGGTDTTNETLARQLEIPSMFLLDDPHGEFPETRGVLGTEPVILARDLFNRLGLKGNYSRWLNNITQFNQGEDYELIKHPKLLTDLGFAGSNSYRPNTKDKGYICFITLTVAKHLCLQSRSTIGKNYRQYLINLEENENNIMIYIDALETLLMHRMKKLEHIKLVRDDVFARHSSRDNTSILSDQTKPFDIALSAGYKK